MDYGSLILLKSSQKFKILFFILFAFSSCAGKSLDLKSNESDVISEYLKIHGEFQKALCTPEDLEVHQTYLKAYRGTGYYIPEITPNHLDHLSLEGVLPKLKEKIGWIQTEKTKLEKFKKLPALAEDKLKLEKIIDELLVLKKKYYYEKKPNEKVEIEKASALKMKELNQLLDQYLKKIPFLLSFDFPVDHLFNRVSYDQLKAVGTQNHKGKPKIHSNFLYLMRKIVEDGAQDPDNTKPDLMLRAAIDTLYLELKNGNGILSENARFDLKYVLVQVDKQFARGKEAQLNRLEEWQNRTQKTFDFYTQLVADYKNPSSSHHEADQILKKLSEDRFNLSDYIYKKQTFVYQFWMARPELFRSLYVLENILYNEVGSVDGRDALERKDVSKVVLNRYHDPAYTKIPKKSNIYGYLSKVISEKEIENERWLNTMFKEGEFSFTYYFIPSAIKIFCTDQSRTGLYLQKENLKIALDSLRQTASDFSAIRYFSRASMVGRIDMSTVWKDYVRLPESKGLPLQETSFLKKKYGKGKYQYLYSFNDPDGLDYDVVEIDNETVVVQEQPGKSPLFFGYRNPHNFIYFKKRSL